MKDAFPKKSLRAIIAANLSELRHAKGMTQYDLAQQIGYTDKAVSKWERGESLPDIEMLYRLACLYQVDLDYFTEEHDSLAAKRLSTRGVHRRNRRLILGMSILLVWLIAALVFFILSAVSGFQTVFLLSFLYAVPVTCIVHLVLNSVWFQGERNFLIISALMWSLLLSLFFSLWFFADKRLPFIFILGIPGQLIILLASKLRTTASPAHWIDANRFDKEEAEKQENVV